MNTASQLKVVISSTLDVTSMLDDFRKMSAYFFYLIVGVSNKMHQKENYQYF